jgi:hypothetical protein
MLFREIAMEGWTEPPDQGSLLVKRNVLRGSIVIDEALTSVFNMSSHEIVTNTCRTFLSLMLPLPQKVSVDDGTDNSKK